jgi:hypothetical protein
MRNRLFRPTEPAEPLKPAATLSSKGCLFLPRRYADVKPNPALFGTLAGDVPERPPPRPSVPYNSADTIRFLTQSLARSSDPSSFSPFVAMPDAFARTVPIPNAPADLYVPWRAAVATGRSWRCSFRSDE